MGKILVSIGAILAICAAAACGSTGGKSHAAAAASQSTTAASTPPASPSNSAPSLSRGTQAFVNQIRSGLGRPGYSNSGTDAQVASVGTQICNAREQGNTQAETISASHSVRTQWELSPKAVVRAAEKNICPSYVPKPPPKPKVVARFNGSGIQTPTALRCLIAGICHGNTGGALEVPAISSWISTTPMVRRMRTEPASMNLARDAGRSPPISMVTLGGITSPSIRNAPGRSPW
jgi:hypothetical protein